MIKCCKNLIDYKKDVDNQGGVTKINDLYEHAICDCVNRLGDSIKHPDLGFDQKDIKMWTGLRVITAHHYHKLDLSKIWDDLAKEAAILQTKCEAKLV